MATESKPLTEPQTLMLRQAAEGALVLGKLDGYGERVLSVLEERGFMESDGEQARITDAGRAVLSANGASRRSPQPSKAVRAGARGRRTTAGKANANGTVPVQAKSKPITLDARLAALAALDAEYKAKRAAVELAAPYFAERHQA